MRKPRREAGVSCHRSGVGTGATVPARAGRLTLCERDTLEQAPATVLASSCGRRHEVRRVRSCEGPDCIVGCQSAALAPDS